MLRRSRSTPCPKCRMARFCGKPFIDSSSPHTGYLVANPLHCDATISMDAKFGFDDNADFRQKDVFALRDTTQEDAQEVEAAEVSAGGSWISNHKL